MSLVQYSAVTSNLTSSGITHHTLTPNDIIKDTRVSITIEIDISAELFMASDPFNIIPSFSYVTPQDLSFQFYLQNSNGDTQYLVSSGAPDKEFLENSLHSEKVNGIKSCIDFAVITLDPGESLTLGLQIKSITHIDLRKCVITYSTVSTLHTLPLIEENQSTCQLHVPSRSQMFFESEIKNRVCSPTSLSMLLDYYHKEYSIYELLAKVYNHAEKIYGVWPQAIYGANKYGLQGYCGFLESLHDLNEFLTCSLPLIASIQYNGDLDGAPLASSRGHLVVITGISGGTILVNDPAIENSTSVEIEYNLNQFMRCWSRSSFLYYCIYEDHSSN